MYIFLYALLPRTCPCKRANSSTWWRKTGGDARFSNRRSRRPGHHRRHPLLRSSPSSRFRSGNVRRTHTLHTQMMPITILISMCIDDKIGIREWFNLIRRVWFLFISPTLRAHIYIYSRDIQDISRISFLEIKKENILMVQTNISEIISSHFATSEKYSISRFLTPIT